MNTWESSPKEATFEKKPKYVFMITRHAERLASGELSPDGVESANEKGEQIGEEAEVMKAYTSDEKSNRTFITGNLISEKSGIKSELTGEQYATRKVEDIQYGILNPDLKNVLSRTSDLINEETLKELGESTERDEAGKLKVDLTKLPDQEKIAPIRAKNQIVGFRYILGEENDEAVTRMAMGLAQQLNHEFEMAGRYDRRYRDGENPKVKKDTVLNTVTHGMFMESLLKKAGVVIGRDGQENPISDFESEDFGGFINTNESIYLDIENPGSLPDKIPVRFEGGNRPETGKVFIDRNKLLELVARYKEWKKSQEEKSE
ncbi:MAG: hypothetical protein ACD_15C00227G0002 [uncultured bacterium]|nr:MAG: hypothetical protein ACD_15C00227G0002 [uncultured bacterium]